MRSKEESGVKQTVNILSKEAIRRGKSYCAYSEEENSHTDAAANTTSKVRPSAI